MDEKKLFSSGADVEKMQISEEKQDVKRPENLEELKQCFTDFFEDCLKKSHSPCTSGLAFSVGCKDKKEFWRWCDDDECYSAEWRNACNQAFETLMRVRWILQQSDRPRAANSSIDDQIWNYAAANRPVNERQLRKRFINYFNNYKNYSNVPSLAILELVAGASEEYEFLRWCDGVGCSDKWRNACRVAYMRMREIVLKKRYKAVKNAQKLYKHDKDALERWWME